MIGFIVRRYKHRHLGEYNLNAPRPKTYVIKILLQFIMAINSWVLIWDVNPKGEFQAIALVYFFYGFVWIISNYLIYFEYKRGLPHAWYTHQMFWILSALSNILLFYSLTRCLEIFDLDQKYSVYLREMKIKHICTSFVGILTTCYLVYLGLRYRREFP